MQARVKEIIHDWRKYSNRNVWPCWSPGHSISQCLSVKLAVGSHTTAAAPCKQAQLRDKGYLLHVSSLPWLLPEPGLVPQHKAALHSEHGPACSKLAQASLTRPSIMLFRPDNFVSSSIQTPWNVRNWSQMHIDVLKSSWILFRSTQVPGLSPGDGSNIMAYDTKGCDKKWPHGPNQWALTYDLLKIYSHLIPRLCLPPLHCHTEKTAWWSSRPGTVQNLEVLCFH